MRKTVRLHSFRGLFTSKDGVTPPQAASDLLNVRVGDGRLRARAGLHLLSPRPAGFGGGRGLASLSGYDDSYRHKREFLSIETRDGEVSAFALDPATGTRVKMTTPPLPVADYSAFSFGGRAYVVAPGAVRSLFSYEIGQPGSWRTLQDSAYTPPPTDPDLTISANPTRTYGWDSGDTWSYTSTDGILPGATFTFASGVTTVNGSDNDNGRQHRTRFEVSFGTPLDASASDLMVLEVAAARVFNTFERTNIAPQVRIGTTWHTVEFREFLSDGNTRVAIALRVKGLTERQAVLGLRFTVGGSVASRSGSGDVCRFERLIFGGSYLESTGAARRIWDASPSADGIRYGVRYRSATAFSALKSGEIQAAQSLGPRSPAYSCPLGGRILLSTPAATTGGFTDVEFLRLAQDGQTWKLIGTVPNSGSPQCQDVFEEHELAALPTVTNTGFVPPPPAPKFLTTGLQSGFAYKGWVIWLFAGGKSNVKHSRVGNPEELFDPLAVYESADETHPADFTLADDFADEPIGGVQAGGSAILLGRRGVYTQTGESPRSMSPCSQIPGSTGVAGPYAFARYRPGSGQYGCAYVDPAGNCWFIVPRGGFAGDNQAKPVELSMGIRGEIRSFLLTDQREEFGFTDLSRLKMEVDEPTGSLWLVLGRRAMVLRPADPVSGESHWEKYEYNLVEPALSSTTATMLGPSLLDPALVGGSVSAVDRAGANREWQNLSAGLVSDDYRIQSAPVGLGDSTKVLRFRGLRPSAAIPTDALIQSVEVLVEDRHLGDPVTAVEIRSDLARLALAGSMVGADQSDWAVSAEDTVRTLGWTNPGVTPAQINSGELGLDLGYRGSLNGGDYAPGLWTLSTTTTGATQLTSNTLEATVPFSVNGSNVTWQAVADQSTSATYRPRVKTQGSVTYRLTYTGPNPVPSYAVLRVESSVTAATSWPSSPVVLTADNGLGSGATDDGLTRTSQGLRLFRVPIVNRTGELTLTIGGESDGGLRVWVSQEETTFSVEGSINASLVNPTAAPVGVDAVRVLVRFTQPVNEPERRISVGFDQVAFGFEGTLLALTSGGRVLALERKPTNQNPLVGVNRDAGSPMPTGHWTSGEMAHGTFRLNSARVDSASLFTGRVLSTHNQAVGFFEGARRDLWFKFPLGQRGSAHRIRVEVTETSPAIQSVELVFTQLSRP